MTTDTRTTPAAKREDEREAVRRFLTSRGCTERIVDGGIDALITEWARIAESVATGYKPDSLDDYLNDMDVRELIALTLASVPAAVRPARRERLAAADARIRSALKPRARCLWGPGVAASHRWKPEVQWWYFMQPGKPGPGLARELES